MQYVTATEAKQELGALLDSAQRAPVTIRKHKRDYAVILSAAEYERLQKARIQALHLFSEEVSAQAQAQGLTEETLLQILNEHA